MNETRPEQPPSPASAYMRPEVLDVLQRVQTALSVEFRRSPPGGETLRLMTARGAALIDENPLDEQDREAVRARVRAFVQEIGR